MQAFLYIRIFHFSVDYKIQNMQAYLVKFIYVIIGVMPFLSPIRPDLGWFNASPENMKTAWGVVATIILFTIWMVSQYQKGKLKVVKTSLYLPIIGFIFWCTVTLLWVEDGYLASIMLSQFISYGLIFFIVINTIRKTEVINIINILIVSMSVISIIGLLQYYFSDIQGIRYFFAQTSSPSATFANKNMASHFIVMTLPLAIILLLTAKNKFNIFTYSIASTIGLWFLIYTSARQAYVAIALELFILVLFIALDIWKNKKSSIYHNSVLKLLKLNMMMLTVIFLSIVSNSVNTGYGSNKLKDLQSIVGVEAGSARFPAWVNTTELIKDNFLTGVGIGQWPETYPLYYDRVKKDVIFNEKTRLKRLHNDYLEMFANFGLIGYVFLLWLLYLISKIIFSILLNNSSKHRDTALAITLGLVGFSVVAFFSFPVRVYLPAFLVLVYFSLLFQLNNSLKIFFVIDLKRKTLNLFFFLILVSSFISVFSFKYAHSWLVAEYYSLNTSALITLKKYNSAINHGLEALLYNKRAPDYYFMVGNTLLNLNKPKESVFFLKKTIDISPFNTRALLQLAVAYQSSPKPDLEMERKVLEFILSFDPKNVNALSFLVKNLSINNRGEDATIVYKRLKNSFEYFKGRSNFGPYHSIIGLTAMSVGDYKYAQYIYQDAIKRSPSAKNYYNLAILEFDYLKNYNIGVDLAKKSLSINPNIVRHEEIRLMIEKYESITKQ